MEAIVIWLIIIGAIVLIVLPFIFTMMIPGLYWALAMFAIFVFIGLDYALGASLFPRYPWIMWFVWGGIIGATFGFWTVAPIYGLREYRRLIFLAPFLLIVVVTLLRLLLRQF